MTRAGPGMGMTRGSVPQARWVSSPQVAGSGALTARVKYMTRGPVSGRAGQRVTLD